MVAGAEVSARDDILSRVRTALVDIPPSESPADVVVPRNYVRSHVSSDVTGDVTRSVNGSVTSSVTSSVAELFAERVADYRASVVRVGGGDVAAEIARALADTDAVVAPGFPLAWLPDRHFRSDDPPLATNILDGVGAAVTTAAVGIALTGTIVLDAGAGQGRRALTLVPDMHICVIRADQIADDVPDALDRLDPTRPLTFISGPSATSDIELQRVEGVHGPRTLHVIIVDSAERGPA
jgi:L-lactate dehydrogenase complex protein LldG